MNAFSIIRYLRERSHKLRAPLALLYLLLGMAAAWHSPHDIRANSPVAIQSSHSSAAAALDTDAFCALCSWQSLNQETAVATQAAAASMPLVEASASTILSAPARGFSQAHLARGPPSV